MHAQTEIRELTAEEINQVDGGAITRLHTPDEHTRPPLFGLGRAAQSIDRASTDHHWPSPVVSGLKGLSKA
jgi:hypothetical protein